MAKIAHKFIPTDDMKLKMVYPGQWIRTPMYSEPHKVAAVGTDAVCGRPLHPDLFDWVVEDGRKEHCARCESGPDYSK